MGRSVDIDEVVGAAEIAARLGVAKVTVRQWDLRYAEFPRPVARLEGGRLWVWGDIEAWARSTDRLPT